MRDLKFLLLAAFALSLIAAALVFDRSKGGPQSSPGPFVPVTGH